MRTSEMFRGSLPNLTTEEVSTGWKQAVLNQPLAARDSREPDAFRLHPDTRSGRIHRPCAPKYPWPPPKSLRADPGKNWYALMGTPLRIVVMPLTRHPPTIPFTSP